jgi:predicted type IV restriction endonuclease
MSAVLQSPTLPMLAAMEERFNVIEARIKALEDENMEMKVELLETKELLAISLKRNTQLENAIFEHDSDGEILRDEDNIPKVSIILSAPIATGKPAEEKAPELPIIPSTTLEIKAAALVEHLKGQVKPRSGEVFLNSREIINYLKTEIPEELRLKDIKNPRQAKKDILEKAVKLFSDTVLIIRNKSGNKVTGIALKPSVKRPYTDTCY